MDPSSFEAMIESLDNDDDETSYPDDPSLSTNNASTFNHSSSLSHPPVDQAADIFYGENYFDLNDILAQSQRMSVKFVRKIPMLSFLDPGQHADEPDMLAGTKLGNFNSFSIICVVICLSV